MAKRGRKPKVVLAPVTNTPNIDSVIDGFNEESSTTENINPVNDHPVTIVVDGDSKLSCNTNDMIRIESGIPKKEKEPEVVCDEELMTKYNNMVGLCSEYKDKINILNSKISDMETELTELRTIKTKYDNILKSNVNTSENTSNLISEVKSLKDIITKNNNTINSLNEKITLLENENDNLIIQNSELSFEVTRLRTIEKQVPVPEKPTPTPIKSTPICDNVPFGTKKNDKPTRSTSYISRNGYEFWN